MCDALSGLLFLLYMLCGMLCRVFVFLLSGESLVLLSSLTTTKLHFAFSGEKSSRRTVRKRSSWIHGENTKLFFWFWAVGSKKTDYTKIDSTLLKRNDSKQ